MLNVLRDAVQLSIHCSYCREHLNVTIAACFWALSIFCKSYVMKLYFFFGYMRACLHTVQVPYAP